MGRRGSGLGSWGPWCLALACVSAMGCITIPPWERGSLAHESMDPEAEAVAIADDFIDHISDIRHGAICGTARAGGGCGCN